MSMFIAALFGKGQKLETTQMSRQDNEYTTGHHLARRRTDTVTWDSLQSTAQNEVNPKGHAWHIPSNDILDTTK